MENSVIILFSFLLSSATVLYEHLQAILQSLHRFAQAVLANLIQASLKLFLAAVFFVLKLKSVLPIYIFYMISPILPVILAKKLLPKNLKFTPYTQQQIQLNINQMAFHSAISFIVAGIIENIDVLFVQHFLTSYETGLLGGVSRISLLFYLAAYSLGSVLNPRAARYKQKAQIKSFFKKGMVLNLLAIFGFIILAPLSKFLIWLTIGPQYLAGSQILIILLASAFLTVAIMPLIALFFSFDVPWYFSLSGFIQLAVVVTGNLILIPKFGLAGAAWTRLISRLCLYLFSLFLVAYYYAKIYRPNFIFKKEN